MDDYTRRANPRFQSVPRTRKSCTRREQQRSISPYGRLDPLPVTARLRPRRNSPPRAIKALPALTDFPLRKSYALSGEQLKVDTTNARYLRELDYDEVNIVSTPSTIHEHDKRQSTELDQSLLKYYQEELDRAAALQQRKQPEPERSETPKTEGRRNKAIAESVARRVSKLPPLAPGVKVYHFTKTEIGRVSPHRAL